MPDEEDIRRQAREQIVRDFDGVPSGWTTQQIQRLEDEHFRRIAAASSRTNISHTPKAALETQKEPRQARTWRGEF